MAEEVVEITVWERMTSPSAIKTLNLWLTMFWILNLPPVIVLYFTMPSEEFQRKMLLYLVIVSIWANLASHFSGWVAGRVEVKQEEAS